MHQRLILIVVKNKEKINQINTHKIKTYKIQRRPLKAPAPTRVSKNLEKQAAAAAFVSLRLSGISGAHIFHMTLQQRVEGRFAAKRALKQQPVYFCKLLRPILNVLYFKYSLQFTFTSLLNLAQRFPKRGSIYWRQKAQLNFLWAAWLFELCRLLV